MQTTVHVTRPLRGQRGPEHAFTDHLVQSEEGREISVRSEHQRQLRNGSYWFDPLQRRELKAVVRSLGHECGKPDWDGIGAAAVQQHTIERALVFIDALPMGYAEPDPGADPDGEISFSWIGHKGHRLSLSIGPTGRISYAYRAGARRINGTEWMGNIIPEELLKLISTFPINE